MKKQIIVILLIIFSNNVFSQESRIKSISETLDKLSNTIPGLKQTVDFSTSSISIQEFVRALGINNKINISIDPNLNIKLNSNFSGVSAKDVLIFLCDNYNLDLKTISSIITVFKYEPIVKAEKYVPKNLEIIYDKKLDLISLNCTNDSLYLVFKKITDLSGKNFTINPEIRNQLLNTYIKEMPLVQSLELISIANGIEIKHNDAGYFTVSKKSSVAPSTQNQKGLKNQDNYKVNVEYLNGFLSIDAENCSISEILNIASEKSNSNYYLLTPIEKQITAVLRNISFDELLLFILTGSEYSYFNNDGVYVIGKKDDKGLKVVKAIKLQHRSVENVITLFPSVLKTDIELIEFREQNSIIASGNQDALQKLEKFILEVDKIIPMIVIDVLIIDNTSNYTISTGIEAGISDEPVSTSISILPETDITLGSESINRLLNSFNGYGYVNLGQVTPNFYLSLKAMESNGLIKVNSTPKLSTLNGSEATLTLGNTTYYWEERNDLITTQSTQNITTKQYKELKADFKVTIKPIVSGDDQITLEITVDQSDFTGEVVDGAPPGKVTRNFSSIVRVKNQEMILLGGLEKKVTSDESTGVPLISRIPVLKWLFSKRSKSKSSEKLNIFIKPTVIY